MPDFDVFSPIEIRKRKLRSHGKRQKGNDKRKRCAAQYSGTSLYSTSSKLWEHGRHAMLSFLSSLPIPVLRILDIEANRLYDRNHQMYEAALLTRCYTHLSMLKLITKDILSKSLSLIKDWIFSSPEPLGSLVELIVYPSSRSPSFGVRRPSASIQHF